MTLAGAKVFRGNFFGPARTARGKAEDYRSGRSTNKDKEDNQRR